MHESPTPITLRVEATRSSCPIGETVGAQCMDEGKTPVFSCEGACIRGEIARLAANMVAREEPFRRGCHGELLTAPHSAMARWAETADRVVVIDGCFMRCHGRIMRHLIGESRLVELDALSRHKRYCHIFDMDEVPEPERREVARDVADWVLEVLGRPDHRDPVAVQPCTAERR